MANSIRIVLLINSLGVLSCRQQQPAKEVTPAVSITPTPAKILYRAGTTTLANSIWVVTDVSKEATSSLATYLKEQLMGIDFKDVYIGDIYSTRKHSQFISLILDNTTISHNPEAYTLELTSARIKVKAGSHRGIFYGIQTLVQILEGTYTTNRFIVPKLVVKDQPRHSIRGVLVNKLTTGTLTKELYQQMARLKLNTIFVVNARQLTEDSYQLASSYFLDIRNANEIPAGVQLISLTANSDREAGETLTAVTENRGQGIILNISLAHYDSLPLTLRVLAEQAWAGEMQPPEQNDAESNY